MANRMRWRYGSTNPVMVSVCDSVRVEIGDMVWLDKGEAKPATLAPDIDTFRRHFLGVAMQQSLPGDGRQVRVATSGVFEFDCEPGTFDVGERIEAVWNQKVAATDSPAAAVGRCAASVRVESGRVLVDIVSRAIGNGVMN